ncbi:hypothetical protein PENSPDRAFT_657792 [Peniophora sp. CONT]|nr:hypothetical protein PENSPDRAFT_657792 [Peniophora sp. CONT]
MSPPSSSLASKFNPADNELIHSLHHLHKKSPKLVRSSKYNPPSWPELTLESWKMNEYKYHDIPSPFPTLARGLFTARLDDEDQVGGEEEDRYVVVARGYDKFFNIGEVPWTTWASLEEHTKPPYTLTLKSNGCIIFIAPLSPERLVVCSKHSLGPVTGVKESHAQAGERWLEQHLKSVGKTKEDLAKVLWEKNWTAVAELCDDEFEEHVLPYPRDKAGLHLHGLNNNNGAFETQPPSIVDAFAREWGMVVTLSTDLNSVEEVRSFTDEVSKTGRWRGEAIEGFVVRTTVSHPPEGRKGGASASPYAPGTKFFFKVKFDEPYMMYRDWREVTKSLLSCKTGPDDAKLPKSKMKRAETKLYVNWVKAEIKRDAKQFELYTKGRGIISTRERFLEWLESDEGKKQAKAGVEEAAKEEEPAAVAGESRKTIIVPIAIPGVGKTAVAVALAHLFGFGHTQSDDVKAKKAAPAFIRNVTDLLDKHDVVIADKNNHLRQHREQLREVAQKFKPPARLLAMHWALDEQPTATIHRICADRILERGTNHQSLHGDATAKAHEDVIWQFINNAEELADGEVDETIEMDVSEELEDSLARAIEGVCRTLKVERPSPERIGEALAAIRGYKPASTDAKKIKSTPVRYFGLLPEFDIRGHLDVAFSSRADVPALAKEFWEQLKADSRVTDRPHITITHVKAKPDEGDTWDRCDALYKSWPAPAFKVKLGRVLCDGNVMALVADELAVDSDEGQKGAEFVSLLPETIRSRLHITVGTRTKEIEPFQAGELVKRWRAYTRNGIEEVELPDVWVKGRVRGLAG